MRARRSLLVLLSTMLVLGSLGGPTLAQDAPPAAALTGQVTDTLTGAPVVGATLHLHVVQPEVGPSGPIANATTDADGRYRFDDEDALERATHLGYHGGAGYEKLWRWLDLPDTTPRVLDLDLYPTSGTPKVRVTAIDAVTEVPLPSVTAFLMHPEGDASPIDSVPYEGTGDGFVFHRLQQGLDVQVNVVAAGYEHAWSDAFSWDGGDTIEVVVALGRRHADVAFDATHLPAITWLLDSGIAQGYPDGTFQPDRYVTRAQMATFLATALELPPGEATFPDVDPGATHAAAIAAIADAGISRGYPDGTFRPQQPVLRDQMATFLAQALGLDPVILDLPDVPADHTHAGSIGAVVDAGIARGYEDGTFRPGVQVTRGQMATFLMQALVDEG